MPQQQTDEKPQIDADLVNAVINATVDVFKTMANTEATFKEVRAEEDYRASGDISAVIGIHGEYGEGMLALSFPLNFANLLVSRLLGVQPMLLSSEDRCDGVGELVNMISGNTKATLSLNSGHIYKLSLPTVILGHDHHIANRPKGAPYLVIIFETEGESFSMQVAFKSHNGTN